MSQLAGLGSLPLYALDLALFLLPGFAIALLVSTRRNWCGERALMTMLVASASLGYIAFWVYFAGRSLGRAFSYGVMGAALAITVALLRTPAARAVARTIAVPIGYVAAVGACYTCLLFLYQDPWPSGAEFANVRFFNSEAPGDNQIPLIFAERIYAHEPLEPFCCGDWRSSDRPPLQAGIFLLQRPFKLGNVRLNYQLLATGLQCIWICGVWVLLKSFGGLGHQIQQFLGFLVFWAFLFYNSVYVWPKLLAAAFVLFTFSILFEAARKARQVTWFETGLGALSFGLALLAHPGSAFSAPALLLLLIRNRRLWSARKLVGGAIVIGLLLAPWLAYQKFYDPPGNRLLKMHLAGVPDAADTRSTWQAIRDAYLNRSPATIAQDKWENLKTLLGPYVLPHSLDAWRAQQRDYLSWALGVLKIGALVTAWLVLKRVHVPRVVLLAGIAIFNLLVWCAVMIGPGDTITATASYADMLLLAMGLVGFLLMLPRWIVLVLFAIQIVNLFVVWVFVRPVSELQWPLLVAGLALSGALMWHLAKSASPDASPECPLRY